MADLASAELAFFRHGAAILRALPRTQHPPSNVDQA